MPSRTNCYPFGLLFGGTLVLSWTLMTLGVALAIWSEPHASAVRLASWVSLWTFTVLAPTLTAVALHRAIGRCAENAVADDSFKAELARLRPLLLLSANMALLSACALVFGR